MDLRPHPKPSGNIHSIGVDHDAGELHVRFREGGAIYIYGKNDEGQRPSDLHKQWLDAESPGKFFHSNIKGRFPHRLLEAGGES